MKLTASRHRTASPPAAQPAQAAPSSGQSELAPDPWANELAALASQTDPPIQMMRLPNHTGLPDDLKNGIEAQSGVSLDDVRVHTNSSQPAQLDALAYTQGSDIHVAPGQERHLPHEAWHVVQQKQGRVQPTTQIGGAAVNDDPALEHEASDMGRQAAHGGRAATTTKPRIVNVRPHANSHTPIQMMKFVLTATGETKSVDEDYELGKDEKFVEAPQTESLVPTTDTPLEVSEGIPDLLDFFLKNADLSVLSSKDLASVASVNREARGDVQSRFATRTPASAPWQNRAQFHFGTRGRLLSETNESLKTQQYYPKESAPPDLKQKAKDNATSAYDWYQRTAQGQGPITVGRIDDQRPVRSFASGQIGLTSTPSIENEQAREDQAQNTRFLQANPWSADVNAAFVTGALHAQRPIVGISTPNAANLTVNDPTTNPSDRATVYTHELDQPLQHGYEAVSNSGLNTISLPQPLTGGGVLLRPTSLGSGRTATIDDYLPLMDPTTGKERAKELENLLSSKFEPITTAETKKIKKKKKKKNTK